MISDINSMLNPSQNRPTANGASLANIATLAKLTSEIKFIESMSLIKILSSEPITVQDKPAQLLHAAGPKQQMFSLINTGLPIAIDNEDNVQLTKGAPSTTPSQRSEPVTYNPKSPQQATQPQAMTQTTKAPIATTATATPAATSSVTSLVTTPTAVLNTNQGITIKTGDAIQIIKNTSSQVSLIIQSSNPNTQAPPATAIERSTANNQVANLAIASKVVNLTVTQTPSANTNTSSTNQNTSNSVNTSNAQNSANTSDVIKGAKTGTPSASNITTTSPNLLPNTNNATSASPTPQNINASQTNTSALVAADTANSVSNTLNTRTPPSTQMVMVTDGDSEFPILSQMPLKKGDTIRVIVDANNNLQVLPNKTDTTPASTIQLEALKQSLPKQLTSNDMSQLIRQLQTLNESTSSQLPARTQQALNQLIQSIPSLAQLTSSSEAMKQAIQTSGVFSEALLKDNKIELPADLKLNLTRLNNIPQEENATSRLPAIPMEQVANAIERLTTTQLRNFSDTNQTGIQNNYPLYIELPIKNGQTSNLVQMKIDQEDSNTEIPSHERRWLVQLKFDFEETGKFEVRSSIQGKKVSITFAAETPETVQKIRENMDQLKQQLNEKNIEVEQIEAFQARLKDEKTSMTKNRSLIDVRT